MKKEAACNTGDHHINMHLFTKCFLNIPTFSFFDLSPLFFCPYSRCFNPLCFSQYLPCLLSLSLWLKPRKHLDLVSEVASLPQCFVPPFFKSSTLKKQPQTRGHAPSLEFWDTHGFLQNFLLEERCSVSKSSVRMCLIFSFMKSHSEWASSAPCA